MNEHIHETHVIERDRLPRISWGAIFAGLVVALGVAWMLHLLGIALGLSIADATDTAAMGNGVTSGAALWIVITWLVAFFLGSLVAARLSGSLEDFVGMLHGCTLWGVATIVVVLLGYYGVSSLLQTGQAFLSATAQAAGTAAQGVGSAASGTTSTAAWGAQQLGSAATAVLDRELVQNLRDRLTDRAVQMAANMNRQLTEEELRQAIQDLDERTVRRIVQDLMNQDQEGAAQLLADNTELSEQDAQALVQGVYQELEQQLGNPQNQEPLREDLQNQLARQLDSYVAQADAQGGPDVTEQDVRSAIDQLDGPALQSLAYNLVQGDARGAKRVLVQNTDLSRDQIDELYEGVATEMEDYMEEYQAAVDQAMETTNDYAQSVLWLSFAGAALALVASIGGGWAGTHSARRVYVGQ